MTPPTPSDPILTSRETRGFASEIKFLVNRDTAAAIRDWSRFYMRADEHGAGVWADQYTITSAYFDTAALDVLERRGSYARAKYRVRRYGHEDAVFLERKLRTGTLLAKRRTRVPRTALALLNGTSGAGWAGEWFRRRIEVRRLAPVCQLSYDRMARVAETSLGPIRLTIDEHLHAATFESMTLTPHRGVRLADVPAIVELKYRVSMPALFKALMEDFALTPVRLSKYRLGQAALGNAALAGPTSASATRHLACA
jgi:hypothetical protein